MSGAACLYAPSELSAKTTLVSSWIFNVISGLVYGAESEDDGRCRNACFHRAHRPGLVGFTLTAHQCRRY